MGHFQVLSFNPWVNTEEPFHSCCRRNHLLHFTTLLTPCCLLTLSKHWMKAFTEQRLESQWESFFPELLKIKTKLKAPSQGLISSHERSLPISSYQSFTTTGWFRFIGSNCSFVKKSHTVVSTHKFVFVFAILHCAVPLAHTRQAQGSPTCLH